MTGETVEEAFLTAVNVTAAVDTQVMRCLLVCTVLLSLMLKYLRSCRNIFIVTIFVVFVIFCQSHTQGPHQCRKLSQPRDNNTSKSHVYFRIGRLTSEY